MAYPLTFQKNSKKEITAWAIQALEESELDKQLCLELMVLAVKLIRTGHWRGDISEAWKQHSTEVTTATVPDLYP